MNLFGQIVRGKWRVISWIGVILLFVCDMGFAQPVQDSLSHLISGEANLRGYAGNKINLSAVQVAGQDVEHLVAPFRLRNESRQWQTEFWGKWFTSAVAAWQYNQDAELKKKLDRAVALLLSTQTPDGYIGNYATEHHLKQWDVWGRKYCLLGLLSYYEITRDKKVMQASIKLADHLIQEVHASNVPISRMGNHRGMAATSVLEPVVKLYKLSGEKRYLDFANEIVASWEIGGDPGLLSKANVPVATRFARPATSWWTWEQGQKAYEMMSCYEGLLELYRVTGKKEYKEVVAQVAENIRTSEIMITGSGSSMECWYGGTHTQTTPAAHTMETCVTATWMKLCLQLLRTTGDVKWANEIEKTFYNALNGAMTPDGATWSKYSELSGYRHFGEKQCGMDMNCCTASGPRGMLMVMPAYALMQNSSGFSLNLFTEATYQTTTPDKKAVVVKVETKYPTSPEVIISVDPKQSIAFDFAVRIPEWSTGTTLFLNGEKQVAPIAGSYYHIKRTWRTGDKIKVLFDMNPRVVTAPGNKFFYTLQYGPLVLAADQRLEKQHQSEFLEPKADAKGRLEVTVLDIVDPAIYFSVKVPFKTKAVFDQQTELIFCDYASAGNTWSKESTFQVWIPRLMDIAGKDKY